MTDLITGALDTVKRRHGSAERFDASAGLHDRAVGPDDGGGGAAFAQPAVKFAAGGSEHDGRSAAAEPVSLCIGERRGGDQRESVPDDLIQPEALVEYRVGA
jgi:hypothetical protein